MRHGTSYPTICIEKTNHNEDTNMESLDTGSIVLSEVYSMRLTTIYTVVVNGHGDSTKSAVNWNLPIMDAKGWHYLMPK